MSKDNSTTATLGEETSDTKAAAAAEAAVAPAAAAPASKGKADKGDKPDAATQALINQGFCGKRATITFAPARDENEQDFVFVSVNTVGFQIPRGKPFSVPVEVIEALENAKEMRYGKDGVGREVHRHQFSVR